MSRRVSPLAGFQVTINGRFWVTAEVENPVIREVARIELPSTMVVTIRARSDSVSVFMLAVMHERACSVKINVVIKKIKVLVILKPRTSKKDKFFVG